MIIPESLRCEWFGKATTVSVFHQRRTKDPHPYFIGVLKQNREKEKRDNLKQNGLKRREKYLQFI